MGGRTTRVRNATNRAPPITTTRLPAQAPRARRWRTAAATSTAHIVRAALEAIAYQTRELVEAMEADAGAPLTELRADGGAAANDFLMQFQADILGVAVERPVVIETTALGAAGLAGLQADAWSSPADFLAHRRVERVFEPVIAESLRESLYTRWKEAVARTRGWAA